MKQWVFGKTARARTPEDFPTYKELKVTNTLNVNDTGGGGLRANELIVEFHQERPVWCVEGNGIRPSHFGVGISDKNAPMYTLNTTEVHAVMFEEE